MRGPPKVLLRVPDPYRGNAAPPASSMISCAARSWFKRGDDDSYGFDLQGVLSIHIHG